MLVVYNIGIIIIFSIAFGIVAAVLKFKLKKENIYLFFLFIMFIYIINVAKVTLFPFPICTNSYEPNLRYAINLIPFANGFDYNFRMNTFLTIPFGFGLPFITDVKKKHIFWIALLPGFIIESLQFILALVSGGFTFRTIDVDDIIANYFGIILGFFLLYIFAKIYIRIVDRKKINLIRFWDYVYDKCRNLVNS